MSGKAGDGTEKWPRRGLSDRAIERLRNAPDEPDLSGTPYRLIEEIGHGGMGAVYLAHDAELDRDVALKVAAAPADGNAADLSRRLRQEAAILARLEHPGIVPVHDAGLLPDGRAYYVMKRVRGRRLDEVASEAGAERGVLLRAFGRICEAVASAHANGVLHRDLKPENVMVGPFGEVLVMDWGAAKILGRKGNDPVEGRAGANAPAAPAGATEHGTVIGTPGYMAPEQARGEIASLGPPADVYALGAVLYFLVVRRPPPVRTLEGRDDPLAPRRLDRSIPRALEAIVLRAMAPAPGERYATPEEIAADVARFTERLPVAAYPEGFFTKAARLAVKYQTAIWLVLAYVVMRWLLMYFR